MKEYVIKTETTQYQFNELDAGKWAIRTPSGYITKSDPPWVPFKWAKAMKEMYISPDQWDIISQKLKLKVEASKLAEIVQDKKERSESTQIYTIQLDQKSEKVEILTEGLQTYLSRCTTLNMLSGTYLNIVQEGDALQDFSSKDVAEAEGIMSLVISGISTKYPKMMFPKMPGSSTAKDQSQLIKTILSHYITNISEFSISRSGKHDDCVYFDSGKEVYKVCKKGISSLKEADKVMLRTKSFLPTVTPKFEGIKNILRLREIIPWGAWPMWQVLVWSMGAVWNIPDNPALMLAGEAGTGKTVVMKFLGDVLDPRVGGNIIDVSGIDEDTLSLILSQYRVVILDNMGSKMPERMSNMMCTAITGGSSPRRRLFTTSDLVSVSYTAKIAITALGVYGMGADLQDRMLTIQTKPLKTRVGREEYSKKTAALAPILLGSYLQMTQKVLAIIQECTEDIKVFGTDIRLQDTVALGEAMARVLGAPKNLYAAAVAEAQRTMWNDKLEDLPLATSLKQYFKEIGILGFGAVEKSVKDWTEALNVSDKNGEAVTVRRFSKYLFANEAVLRRGGFTLEYLKHYKGTKGISISYDSSKDEVSEECQQAFVTWLESLYT